VKLMIWETNVATAEPAMPIRGTGPTPKMNTGFKAMSITTDTSMK